MNMEIGKSRITETSIGGTVYIVESLVSADARETAYNKVKRLILNKAALPEKLSEQTQFIRNTDSTSAR